MQRRSVVARALLGGLIASSMLASSVTAAPAWKDVVHYDSESASLGDAAGDVVLSDGLGAYTGDIGGIRDRLTSDSTGKRDQFWFYPSGRRTFRLSVTVGEQTFSDEECNSISIWSRENPDWFNAMSAATAPDPLPLLDARVYCWNKGQIPHLALDYNDQTQTPGQEAECLTVSKADTTWTFSAPAGCLGDVLQETYSKGSVTRSVVADDVSLPFTLSAVISPTSS